MDTLRSRIPLVLLSALFAGCPSPETKPPPDLGDVDEIMATLPKSCAFACDVGCAEPAEPFLCPALKSWNALPHAEACEAWDGAYPAPAKGQCTATDATGEAAAKAGPIQGGGFILPDGHRIRPVGREVLFEEDNLLGGYPMSIMLLPGVRFGLVSDGGIHDNALRVIDLDALAAGGAAVSSAVAFPRPTSLYYGLAWLPPDRALASGGGDAKIYAFDINTVTGQATRAEARDIDLGKAGENPWYAGAIAATGDGKRLLVGPSQYAQEILVISLDAADYGTRLASIPIGTYAIFDLRLDPFDPSGMTFYATDQSTPSRLLEISAAEAKVKRAINLAKSPAQMAFLDATYVAVAEAHADSLSIVNRATGKVDARVPVFEPDSPRGFSPSAVAYDTQNKRLYAALAGVNAVEVYDVADGAPPAVTPIGRLSTGWWPTGVVVDTDGSLVVISGKGHGVGPDEEPFVFEGGNITDRMRGSVQHIPAAELAKLDAHTQVVEAGRRLGELPGHPEVQCPAGADDFPIPSTNTSGPSKVIKHVILLIRENKTYDAVFGDRPDLGDGDPKLILGGSADLQAKIWQNARRIAQTYTNFDNFYTDAEQSLQGHIWTSFSRTNDYVERVWLTTWGRGTRPTGEPVTTDASLPEEGTIFQWLSQNGVDYDNMGEIGGVGPNGIDTKYPGLVYSANLPDTQKSCYMAGRIRLLCDLKPFTYAIQPNDHTNGGDAGSPAPEVMIAVNDEATGMLLDALSHSPRWKDSLLIVTEDDPQTGGDHVDLHRTILFMASPWVRRGYVSHGHYDMASIYKLIAHIYGVPYNNEMMRNALLPFDAFTSTPDYTPYTYEPRVVGAPCNASNTIEAEEAKEWDFSEPDEQPGLPDQIERMMRTSSAARGVEIVKPRLTSPP